MRKVLFTVILALVLFQPLRLSAGPLVSPLIGNSRIPIEVLLQIVKAEDSRNPAPVMALLTNANAAVRCRAALAAGRIGDERAVFPVAALLNDSSVEVKTMAAFALGEIESLAAADAVLKALQNPQTPDAVRSRLVEAAGKIAGANGNPVRAAGVSENPKVIDLGDAILDTLEAEAAKREKQNKLTVLLGLTAALRARPEGGDTVVALFLTNLDGRIRSDAANTLARLRAKNANLALRAMLMSDDDPIARANAARALGAAEDKEALNMLIDAATEDEDSRVRVSAIRTLATLRDPYAVERLLAHGEKLLAQVRTGSGSDRVPRNAQRNTNFSEKNELLEVATTLGRLIPKTNDARTMRFLNALRETDRYRSPETEIALARVAPASYVDSIRAIVEREGYVFVTPRGKEPSTKWQVNSAAAQGLGAIAALDLANDPSVKPKAVAALNKILTPAYVWPDILRALALFKKDNFSRDLRTVLLSHPDPIVRAAAAEPIGDQPKTKENYDALKTAFTKSLLTDRRENDAQLAILDAIFKLDKKESVGTLLVALNTSDYLVRRKAFELLSDKDLQREFPNIAASLENARKGRRDQVLPFSPISGTKLGQLLNTDTDYKRAAARKNGSAKAVLATQKGTFTIDLLPEDAPLTVDNFIKLARSNYFNGLEVHRVVPNFVMQDGDPRGDGNGGPGWSIRCEVNMVPYDRGAVGMALSGKDTGGSQWFVTHSPQPHLDGGYTVFGKVNETDMKVVDKIVRGDKIISVRIVEGVLPQRTQRSPRKAK